MLHLLIVPIITLEPVKAWQQEEIRRDIQIIREMWREEIEMAKKKKFEGSPADNRMDAKYQKRLDKKARKQDKRSKSR